MAGRLKNQWKKLLPDAILPDHHHHHHHHHHHQQQQQQQQQQYEQHQQPSSPSMQNSSSSSSSSSGGGGGGSSRGSGNSTSSFASTPANSPAPATASGSGLDLKAGREKMRSTGLPSNFRKLRLKFSRYKKEGSGVKEENTEFEKVAVQQRPAKSKKKKQSMLKWKEGVKPIPTTVDGSKQKKKYRPKKKRRREKKRKLKLSSETVKEQRSEIEKEQKTETEREQKSEIEKEQKTETEKERKTETEKERKIESEKEQKTTEKELKTMEKEEAEAEIDAEEQTLTEAREEESEFESTTFDANDMKKKETTSTSGTSGTSDASVGSKTCQESSVVQPQISQEPTLTNQMQQESIPVYPTIKNSEEFIAPLMSSSQEPASSFTAEVASMNTISSKDGSKSDSPSTITEADMMFDTEPIILSTPACQVLGIIMKKQLFKNAAASETENDLIRMYFAGKIPTERQKSAQQILERAVSLAVTRVKSSGLNQDLYNFLNNNRVMAISLIIDAMKYRKKEFLPEFWIYDPMNKKEAPPEPPS
ncbi:unnamed protein product [Litomosoides sigmodontis]|uniref:Uncharacterized protein n=1 Tax=Litomosoides sigmodontis TaxID=42156 RepID=A0A3P6TDA8_LITSI|nr:unnamed protein product [Litomosoides sigmodontis]